METGVLGWGGVRIQGPAGIIRRCLPGATDKRGNRRSRWFRAVERCSGKGGTPNQRVRGGSGEGGVASGGNWLLASA